ncbi:MAG: 3-deoxy-7-phosphoheptulonate synthase, partial [Anaerolineales bacterium]|nr:3-deoxy-7-phosphoheptulonate synthase [Anaerolineales bacterium]
MIIVMRANASKSEIDAVSERVKAEGFDTSLVQGTERTIVCVLGDGRPIEQQQFNVMPGVESTTRVLKPFKLSSRIVSSEDSLLHLSNNTIVGSEVVTIIAGPCSVEDRTQMLETAHAVKEAGA